MIISKRLKLRAYKKDEAEKILEILNDFDTLKTLRIGIPFPMRVEEEENWISNLSAFSTDSYSFAIERLKDEKYIGGCGINSIDWKNSNCTVGIFLAKEYRNQGYGTEALKALVKFIFDEMNINKIKLNVYSFNEGAIKSYEKIGFVKEGILRKELFRFGKYHDEIVMGIFKEELKD